MFSAIAIPFAHASEWTPTRPEKARHILLNIIVGDGVHLNVVTPEPGGSVNQFARWRVSRPR
jgi:hypothetical protein